MTERFDQYNGVVDNYVRKEIRHELGCRCEGCLRHASKSLQWLAVNSQFLRARELARENGVIGRMSSVETQAQLDSRMMNMLGTPDIERMLAMVGQNYGELLGELVGEGDPGDEQFFG